MKKSHPHPLEVQDVSGEELEEDVEEYEVGVEDVERAVVVVRVDVGVDEEGAGRVHVTPPLGVLRQLL